jgi:hypothetical protein
MIGTHGFFEFLATGVIYWGFNELLEETSARFRARICELFGSYAVTQT